MQLNQYTVGDYTPGATLGKQILWYFLGDLIVKSYLIPFSPFKVMVLRLFGAKIGQGVRIKPGVKIKFPWRLTVGDFVWIGERVWLDNLAQITIENNVCLSQDVYCCTGNHNWGDPNFALIVAPILLKEGSWLAARSVVAPGVTIGRGAVLGLASVASTSLEPMTIYQGNPAKVVKQRVFQ